MSGSTNKGVNCSFCGSGQVALLADQVRFGNKADVYKCRDCSLVFLDQQSYQFPADFYACGRRSRQLKGPVRS